MRKHMKLLVIIILATVIYLSACGHTEQKKLSLKEQANKVLKDFSLMEFSNKLNSAKEINKDGFVTYDLGKDSYMKFSSQGELMELDLIGYLDELNNNSNNKFDAKPFIKILEGNKYISSDYRLFKSEEMLDRIWFISYYGKSAYDVENKYNQVRAMVDMGSGKIVKFKRIVEFTEDIKPSITPEKAKEIAKTIFDKELKMKTDKNGFSYKLIIEHKNDLYGSQNKGELALLYWVKYRDIIVYVDGLDGSVAGGDRMKGVE